MTDKKAIGAQHRIYDRRLELERYEQRIEVFVNGEHAFLWLPYVTPEVRSRANGNFGNLLGVDGSLYATAFTRFELGRLDDECRFYFFKQNDEEPARK